MHKICKAISKTGGLDIIMPLFLSQRRAIWNNTAIVRTIAFVSHVSKVLLKIILERIYLTTESEIFDKQVGFRNGRGTREQITSLQKLMEKSNQHQQALYTYLWTFKKPLMCIPRHTLVGHDGLGIPATLGKLTDNVIRDATCQNEDNGNTVRMVPS